MLPFLKRFMRLIGVDLTRSRTRVDATWASMASFMAHVHALSSCQRRGSDNAVRSKWLVRGKTSWKDLVGVRKVQPSDGWAPSIKGNSHPLLITSHAGPGGVVASAKADFTDCFEMSNKIVVSCSPICRHSSSVPF